MARAALVQEARARRSTVLRHPPGLTQRTAAHFLSIGHDDAQINPMCKTYKRRRLTMEAALHETRLAGATRAAGGSCFWMAAPEGIDSADLARRLRDKGG